MTWTENVKIIKQGNIIQDTYISTFLSHEFICFAEMLRTDISKLLNMGNRAVSICRLLRRLSADNFFMI